jgi:hypothetical protein
MDEKRREYMRKYMERKRATVNIDVNKLGVNTADVNIEWDKEKYPEKAAWEIAVVRAARAKRYAEMFPNLIGERDKVFQEIDWQYKNEGLPAIRKPDPILLG